ncbi:hypothetical protein Q8A67_007295 [Cirrhinus molitorella]|uniref:Uncharacterized protein n=1 Tax=Cirrhinus molitorella TaxID=172907 RepID=A0AA88Q6T1_9TELE|nr:hypothetical protein Q8A67_007295 [Cirrhinus molitorella]
MAEGGDVAGFKWMDEHTRLLIQWRVANEALFTGKRNAAIKGCDLWTSLVRSTAERVGRKRKDIEELIHKMEKKEAEREMEAVEREEMQQREKMERDVQTLWKNLKLALKRQNAEIRRQRFTTGDGPPNKDKTDELSDLLTGIIQHQQPLEVIPDDDHLNSSDEELSTNEQRDLNRLEEPEHSECVPSTSAPASLRKDAATTFQNRASRMNILDYISRQNKP